MICLRCGYCCKNCMVIVVDDPDKGIVKGNLIPCNFSKKTSCKHLTGTIPGEFSCAVHHYSWYKDTPCFAYGQIESSPTENCRMGKYILENINELC